MRTRGCPFFLHALFGLLTALAQPACGAQPDAAATCRKTLKVEGEGGAPVTATTTVFLDDRFTGFTLTDARGANRPFSLLNRAGSQCAIHFDAAPGETLELHLSAVSALPSEPGFGHRSGLLHLARGYDGRAVQSVAQFEACWENAPFQGGRFEEQVYSASNPFGPNSNTLHRYEGHILIAKPGATRFCVASTDASFLLIDGREVAAWPGRHPVAAGLDGSKSGTLDMQPGPHRFTFLHANGGPESYAIAALVPPGEQRHVVIGPEMFSRAAYAYVGPLTARDGERHADFVWDSRESLTLDDRALHELLFEAAPFRDAPGTVYEWDFGDGARGSGAKASHLYFAQGDIPVTLTATLPDGRKSACRQSVRVAPRYGQSENDDARALALLDRAARQERESGIQPQGYAAITRGYYFFLKEAEAAAFGERVLAALDRIPREDLYPMLSQLALGVQQVGEQYELSERCFRALLARVKEPKSRASAALHFGGMLNLCLNRPQEAREVLSAIRREDLTDWEPRLLDIYLADTALVLDDLATAQKLYAGIPKSDALITAAGIDRRALFDYNSRYFRVQNLLSQGLYRESLPEVDMLEWELPEERASPRINLLKVQALAGNGQPRKAVVCLQRALLAEVDETYTPKLRLELAKLHLSLRQFIPAKRQISLIRKESPWTHEEIEARRLLEELERKIGEVTP